jgi:hypothetical protein
VLPIAEMKFSEMAHAEDAHFDHGFKDKRMSETGNGRRETEDFSFFFG